MAINKNTPVPLYYQLQEILHDKLENGVWKPGDRFPTEEELCEQYSVSRTTVRNALRLLKMEGLIEQARGKGTIVARPKVCESILQSIIGSYALVYPQEGRLSTRVLEKAVIDPPRQIQRALDLRDGQRVSKIARIRLVDGEPLFWTIAFVPYDLCPEFIYDDFEKHSFFELFEKKYGVYITRSLRTITTVLATQRAVNYLGINLGSPLNKVEVVSFTANGTPVECSETYFRSDRVKFEVEITRDVGVGTPSR